MNKSLLFIVTIFLFSSCYTVSTLQEAEVIGKGNHQLEISGKATPAFGLFEIGYQYGLGEKTEIDFDINNFLVMQLAIKRQLYNSEKFDFSIRPSIDFGPFLSNTPLYGAKLDLLSTYSISEKHRIIANYRLSAIEGIYNGFTSTGALTLGYSYSLGRITKLKMGGSLVQVLSATQSESPFLLLAEAGISFRLFTRKTNRVGK